MSVVEDPSYDRWLAVYGDVYEALPGRAAVRCPRCGADALRLVFVGDEAERIGYAAFWCDNCRHGIHLSRVDVPEGAPMYAFRPAGPPDAIPDYTIIVPPPDTADAGEVLTF